LLIIFDLDDTLIDTSGCITPIKLEEALRCMVEAGFYLTDYEEGLKQLRRINEGAESGKEALAEFLEIHNGEKYFELGVKELYEHFPLDCPIFPFDGVIETLKNLAQTHHLALVTAGFSEYQHWKLKKTGIDSTFFSKIAVCEQGSKKNHYKLIFDELGVSRKDVVVCGDRILKDLTPAKELGFRTIHMRKGRGKNGPKRVHDVDYSVNEFYEIPEVITSIALADFLSS
jgi:putative hydrolase of the HAD superfamily